MPEAERVCVFSACWCALTSQLVGIYVIYSIKCVCKVTDRLDGVYNLKKHEYILAEVILSSSVRMVASRERLAESFTICKS